MSRLSALLTVLAVLVAPAAAWAQSELVTDRPDYTESAAIVPARTVQAELGFGAAETAGLSSSQILGALIRFGVHERIELRFGWDGYQLLENLDGAGDTAIGIKMGVSDESSRRPQIALLGTVFLPSGADGVKRASAEPEVRLALAKTLSAAWSAGANLGVALPENARGEREAAGLLSVAFGRALSSQLGAFFEVFGAGAGDWAWSFDTGITVLARPNIQFDVLAGTALEQPGDDWFLGCGLSIRFRQ